MTMDRFVDLYYAVLLLTMLSNRGLFKVSLVYSKESFLRKEKIKNKDKFSFTFQNIILSTKLE